MKSLLCLLVLLQVSYAQEVIVEPSKQAPVYTMPAPIEVEVPYYQPRERVEKIYTAIKDSEFFFEINPLRLSGRSFDFESDQTTNVDPDLELDQSEFNFKLMPLDFKFGFINSGWGSFAEVLIQDDFQYSELVVFAKLGNHRLGGGLSLSVSDEEIRAKSDGKLVARGDTKSTALETYIYSSFSLVSNETLSLDQWNKIGIGYEKNQSSNIKIKGASFTINPALEMMFKINKKLLIGSGIELSYSRLGGRLQVLNGPSYRGVGNAFSYEVNLIKTRFIF
jgi:hypothetical protein